MKILTLTLASALLLISCGDSTSPPPTVVVKEKLVAPQIDKELRTPCISEEREVKGLEDIGLLLVDITEDRDCANTKIVAVDDTLTKFEERVTERNQSEETSE